MTNLFALFPLFSFYFLFRASKKKFQVNLFIVFIFVVLSLIFGIVAGVPVFAGLYAIIFLIVSSYPVFLNREILRTTEHFRTGDEALRGHVEKSKFDREKWLGIRQRVVDEMDRIEKRYAFAKTLVARTDEKSVLTDLSTIFGSTRRVLGLAFSTNLEKEKHRSGSWVASFTSGWVTEEDWSRLIKKTSIIMDRTAFYNLPKDSDLGEQMKSDSLYLVSAPVRWGGEVQGLLTFLMEGEATTEFLDEVSVYAQLLGLGLHKTYLYRMVIEHSRRDGLTNLYLRSIFLERLNDEISFSKRYGTSFSALLLDLDHFKSINDNYGHVIGDKVLRSVADCLRSTLHPGVTIARYGGEEFAVLIGLAPPEEILETAELIRSSIEHLVFSLSDETGAGTLKIGRRKGEIRITVSVGIAHYLPDAVSPNELIRRADAALYLAKDAGRNCVREWKGRKK